MLILPIYIADLCMVFANAILILVLLNFEARSNSFQIPNVHVIVHYCTAVRVNCEHQSSVMVPEPKSQNPRLRSCTRLFIVYTQLY
jgi:hypothetical protein